MKKFKRRLPSNKGFSLLEAMIAIAVSVALAAMVYGVYRVAFAAEKGLEESTAAAQLSEAIVNSYQSLPNFTTLSAQDLINGNSLPKGFTTNGNTIYSPGGLQVALSSETIGGTAGRGFSITYQGVSQKLCTDLSSGAVPLQRFISVQVGQTEAADKGTINESVLAEACKNAPTNVKFTYERGGTGDIAALEECRVPAPETRERACAAGFLGKISEQRTGRCDGPYELPVWNEWTLVEDTCKIECKIDTSSPQTKKSTCPTGYLGEITEQRVSTCPALTGDPVWGDWVTTSNTCLLACVAPAPQSEVDYNACKVLHGADWVGSVITTTTYHCPKPTGNYAVLSKTVEDKCGRTCKSQLPVPNPQKVWQPRSKPCGAGYTGNETYEEEGDVVHSCVNPELSEAPVVSAWKSTGQIRNSNRSACVALCTPNTQLEQWVSVTGQCPIGYIGEKTWQKRQTRTSVCPAGASSPNTSAWSDTGETRNVVDNCIKLCVPPSPATQSETRSLDELRQFACPVGTFGPNPGIDEWRKNNQVRTRTAYCPQTTGDFSWTGWGDWQTASYSDWVRTANHCNNCPSAYRTSEFQWVQQNWGCPAGYSGQNIFNVQQQRDYTVAYSCAGGSSPYQAYTTDYTGWWNTGNNQPISNTCYCGTSTSTQYQNLGCPSGQRVCSPGRQSRTITTDCQGNIVSSSGWTTNWNSECARPNQECR